MEAVLTPMQRAYRRFLSGKPPAEPKNSPLSAVTLATEQRKRLSDILASEAGLKNPRITSMAVVIRFNDPPPNLLADAILVEEGKEGQAIAFLETYCNRFKRTFIISGLQFAVQDGKEKRLFAYPVERTPEGKRALEWSCNRQISGQLRKSN
jgi:hypothetical protein